MNTCMIRLFAGMLTLGVWAGTSLADVVAPVAKQVVEHHLYLHLVSPAEGESVRVVVVEPGKAPIPETVVVAAPAVEEDVPMDASGAGDGVAEEASEEEAVAGEDLQPGLTSAAVQETQTGDVMFYTDLPDDVVPGVKGSKGATSMGLLLFTFVLAIFLGFELIAKVPSQLHTPLMSGSNAISGITIVGALAAAGLGVGGPFGTFLGTLAVAFATINVVGGYMVTNRMLAMFKKKDGGA